MRIENYGAVWRLLAFRVLPMLAVAAVAALAGSAAAACGDPGEDPCSCGFAGLGRCCDYDYLPGLGECSDSSGFPVHCGGTNEPACKIWEHIPSCKTNRVEIDGTCRRIDSDGYPTACGGRDEPACSLLYQAALGIGPCKSGLTEIPFTGGYCRQLDADGFPSFCGGEGERPCNLNEHVPSCKSGLAEVPFPGGDCTRLDADGFPSFCGGAGERPCYVNEHIPSCKLGLFEVGGSCDALDADGYPTGCGDVGEPACSLVIQALLLQPGCKPSTVAGREVAEIPFGNGTCTLLDEQGFPPFCGGESERPCTLVEHIPSCKRDLEENFLTNRCEDTFPAACGRNGQRPCLVSEKLIPCKLGLGVRDHDFGECGENPEDWADTEVPRGGPRSVFLIHGRGGDLENFAEKRASGFNRLAHRLFFEVPNVKHVYGVDWNASGDPARKLTIREYYEDASGSCTGLNSDDEKVCQGGFTPGARCSVDRDCHGATRDHEFGSVSLDYDDFRVYEVARSLAEAIRGMPTEENITIITTSYGGVIGRHLVYRHYDRLRQDGKRIAEMVTLMAPHLGGGMQPDVPGGATAQNGMACAADGVGYQRETWHNVCELGRWHDFRQRREDGILGPPFGSWHIDDRDYPQIRWINAAENGYRLTVADDFAIDTSSLPSILVPPAQALNDLFSAIDGYDSDGTILTASEWGIRSDECYPFTRTPGPQNEPIEVAPLFRENDGVTVLSAQCHHPAARVDSRYTEKEEMRRPHDTNDPDLRDFIAAALSLAGDGNGDGVVDDRDLTVVAHAGSDRSLECAGPLTDVVLDGSTSADPAATGLSFDWSGSFGQLSGAVTTISLPVGTETVTLEVEDGLGRTDVDQFQVSVVDTTAPAIVPGSDVTLEATSRDGASYDVTVDADDLCSETTITIDPDVDTFPLGVTEVAIAASDEHGNVTDAMRRVEVVDTTPPAITPPPGLTAEATAVRTPVATGSATATDLFDVEVSSDAPQEGFPLGVTQVVWTARDENGNEATAFQGVTIEDTTPPVIHAPADFVAEATAVLSPLAIGTATATDIFEVVVTNNAPADGFPFGDTSVAWVATDVHENEAVANQLVTVVDTTPPVLDLPADVVAEATAVLSPLAIGIATATDIFDLTVDNDAPADGYPLGSTTVRWTATDVHGNASGGDQQVTVEDTTPPTLDPPAGVTVTATGPLTAIDLGTAAATDIFEPVAVDHDAPGAGFPPGTTVVTWTAQDANGNASTAAQNVRATYAFGGFLPPLEPGGIYKANRTLPVKFSLAYAAGESVTTAVASIQLVPLGSDDTPGEPLDVESAEGADGGTTFRYTGEHYQFNLGTAGLAAGRYRIVVSIDDESVWEMDIILR